MGLWVLAGSWAADQLTDGFVPRSQVFAWSEEALALAERLVTVGLWEATVHLGEDGWLFHDWIDFQPTKKDVLERREAEREKKRRQRGSCPPGTTPGSPPGSPGTGSSSGSKENPYPESPGDTSNSAHAFTAAAGGECAECGLPAGNRRHIRIVEAS